MTLFHSMVKAGNVGWVGKEQKGSVGMGKGVRLCGG